jgi:exodeoxyribonuclease VII large subunit
VIRDILHRLADRFPVEVLLWPVPVQGQGAAEKIAAAIAGMNALPQASDVAAGAVAPSPLAGEGWDGGVSDSSVLSPRPPTLPSPARREGSPAAPLSPITKPDLLIVARGGGSIEDLWAFNEEVVVRAAAASTIPLISAVGHETDTTLIDFAADMRAPTPTAAAEMAVPVRSELRSRLEQSAASNNAALRKMLQHHKERVEGLSRGLPRPQQLVATMAQTLDSLSERLQHALPQRLELLQQRVQQWAASLPRPEQLVALKTQALQGLMQRISAAAERQLAHRREGLMRASAGLRPRLLADRLKHAQQQLNHASAMLESLSVMNVLKRGFAMVREESGKLVTSAAAMPEQGSVQLQFHDGVRVVMAGNAAPIAAATPSKSRSKKPAPQPGLFDE